MFDALEQARRARDHNGGLVHDSDCGSQCLAIRSTRCLAEEDIDASVESVGGSYDNAIVEWIVGLYQTEVTRSRGP